MTGLAKGLLLGVCVTVSGAMGAQVSAGEQKVIAQQPYQVMRARVAGGDLSVDWRAFRLAALMGGQNSGFAERKVYNQAVGDTDSGKLDAALAAAQNAIDQNMADPEAHLLAARVLEKMGRWTEAERERLIEAGLVRSIFESGDGLTQATAWLVMNDTEERFFITVALGEQVGERVRVGESVGDNGKQVEKVIGVDWAKVKHENWFVMPASAKQEHEASR